MNTLLLFVIAVLIAMVLTTLGEIHTDLHNYLGAPLHK